MSFTIAPDFIITKRRKRNFQPVDPCLGFYISPSCPQSPVRGVHTALCTSATPIPAYQHLKDEQRVNSNAEPTNTAPTLLEPTQAVIINSGENRLVPEADICPPPHATETETLTVEQFLRRAASPVTKRYTRQRVQNRKRNKRVEPNSEDSYHPSSTHQESDLPDVSYLSSPLRKRRKEFHWSSDEGEHTGNARMSLAKRRCRPRKNARTLAARLLLAGAATGVDMVGGPLQPESKTHTSTRQPLPLVPDHRLPSPPAVFRIRRCQYVDPRKVHPLSSASFQFAPPSVHEALPVSGKRALKPVTAWKPDREQILRGSPCIVRPKVVPKPAERSTAIPLVLAPAMNGDIKDRKGPCQPKPLAKLERKPPSPQAEIPFGPFVPPSPKHAAPPSAIGLLPCAAVIRTPPSPLETSTELTCDSLTSPLRCSPPLTKTRDGYVATLSEELDTDPKDGSPSYTSGIKPYPVLADGVSSLLASDDTEGASHAQYISRSGTPESLPIISARPMKSLGSLLDRFRDIARNATQVTRIPHNKRPRPRAMHLTVEKASGSDLDLLSVEPPSSPFSTSRICMRSSALSTPSLSIMRLQDRIKRATQNSTADSLEGLSRELHGSFGAGNIPLERYSTGVASNACAAPAEGPIDVLAALQDRGRDILHLPSSPLPGWSVLPLESSNAL